MKQHNFIKYNPSIKRFTGCDRATLILAKIEFFFSKQPDGFYKFIEPCSHRLYREGDSWAEELGCDRKCFARSWEKIGFKHKSRFAFEAAEDKFEGKLYASFYDRYTNQTFFIRNHELANETLKEYIKAKKPHIKYKNVLANNSTDSLPSKPLSTGHNVSSYNETQRTSMDLSKDKSHAEEIVKKMIEIWTALVEEGRGQIELTSKRIAFLKQAFKDKFDSCLNKWKKYCENIVSSKFLMGETKTPFRVTLDWALKFESIQKILEGNYNIGDRNRLLSRAELEERKQIIETKQKIALEVIEEEIKNNFDEPDPIKNFRLTWLHLHGEQNYRKDLENCSMEIGEEETTLIIRPQERCTARALVNEWNGDVLSKSTFKRVQVYHCLPDFLGEPLIVDRWFGDMKTREGGEQKGEKTAISPETLLEEENFDTVSPESYLLRNKLKEIIPPWHFPRWLEEIEVQELKPDGTLRASFENEFMADYCKKRFYRELLQAAREIWEDVAEVSIQEKFLPESKKLTDSGSLPSSQESKTLSNGDGGSKLEQAIQSFLEVCALPQGSRIAT